MKNTKIKIVLFLICMVFISGCNKLCSDDDQCYQKAIKTQDNIFCEEITSLQLKDSCISELAVTEKDCNQLKGQVKSKCLYDIFVAKDNSEGCLTIESEYWKDICFNYFGKDKNNPMFCKEIADKKLHDECYADSAIDTENAALCMAINDEISQKECIKTIAIETIDPSICDYIYDRLTRYAECYHVIGVRTQNISLCESIPINAIHDSCIEKVNNKLE